MSGSGEDIQSRNKVDFPVEPGGYLQWSEPDMMSTSATTISPSTSKSATEQLVKLMKKPGPLVEIE